LHDSGELKDEGKHISIQLAVAFLKKSYSFSFIYFFFVTLTAVLCYLTQTM
jgi:hypothetical protein